MSKRKRRRLSQRDILGGLNPSTIFFGNEVSQSSVSTQSPQPEDDPTRNPFPAADVRVANRRLIEY